MSARAQFDVRGSSIVGPAYDLRLAVGHDTLRVREDTHKRNNTLFVREYNL